MPMTQNFYDQIMNENSVRPLPVARLPGHYSSVGQCLQNLWHYITKHTNADHACDFLMLAKSYLVLLHSSTRGRANEGVDL